MAATTFRLFRLFLASYAPLAVILAIRESHGIWPPPSGPPTFWVSVVLAVIGMLDAYRLPRAALQKGHIRVTLSEVTEEGGQVAAYVATYLLPFIGVEVDELRDGLMLLLYFMVLFIVFVRSDLGLVNPALYLTGWHVVSARRAEHRVLMLVPHDVSVSSGELYAVTFGDFLVYEGKVAI